MNESKERKIGAILSYITIFINIIIQLIYTPFLIKMLGKSEYGLYSLVASIIGYLIVMDLGFGNAIIVYTAKYRVQKDFEKEKILHGMFNLIFKLMGFIAIIIGLFIYSNIEKIFGNSMTSLEIVEMKKMMIILSFNLFITFYFAIYNSIISAYEKFTFQKIIVIIHSLLTPSLMVPILFLGYKAVALCIVITLVNLLTLLLNYYYCKRKIKVLVKYNGFDKNIFGMIISYSIWIFLGVIVDKINYSVDNVILGIVSGTVAVSVYSIATTFNTVFINISTAISGVLLPKMTKLVSSKATSTELTDEMIKIGRLQNYVIFLALSGFILLGKNFIVSWVGVDFVQSYYVTLLLIIPAFVPLVQNTGLSIMQAMNKYKFKAISTFVVAIFNVIISVFLAKKWGPVGAAAGTSIALMICNIFFINIYYYKNMKLEIFRFWKEILFQSFPFTIPITLTFFIIKTTNLVGYKAFIIYGVFYVILYSITAYFLSMNKYEKSLIKNTISKFIITDRRKK